ncbi:MAG TPA: GNAT family N-acetyltransferase, partial [Burkholderiales bacterium]|nr:GNAT family N-acetyltransferase [Burkholderiales bacterium]
MEATALKARDATADDVATIAQISVDAWRAAYRGHMPDALLDGLKVEERARMWAGVLARPAPSRLIVTEPVTGFCFYGPSRDGELDVAEIFAIYVRPDCWRQGAGRVLCEHVELDAAARECKALTLWVLKTNEPARHFYERIG